MYEPKEDSFLLQRFVREHVKGVVLDMGTGSGIQAITAARNEKVKKVLAVDIDKESIGFARKRNPHKKITYSQSDLFSKLEKYKHSFDTLIFNPPYLPQERAERDAELEGGKIGNEVIAKFLEQARDYLKPKGIILLLFSSLTPIKELFEKNLFTSKEIGKEHYFFEDLLVYELKIDPRAIELEKKGVNNLKYFAKGKRGIVFTGKYNGKKVAVKLKKESSQASNTIMHEANILKEVNKHKIGPKYLFNTKNALVYEFVEGKYLKDLISSKQINKICRKVFEQCHKLDLIGINKQEMTRPMKHAIIKGNKITLIDFERARKAEETHNVTQFCQFVGNHVQYSQKEKSSETAFSQAFTLRHTEKQKVIREGKEKWIKLAQEYAKNKSKKNFENILEAL